MTSFFALLRLQLLSRYADLKPKNLKAEFKNNRGRSVFKILGVIVLLAGLLVWSAFAQIDSHADGAAQVENGVMTMWFDDGTQFKNVQAGMTVSVGDSESVITSVGLSTDGRPFALADTTLADGVYDAQVVFRRTQVLKLLFN